MDNAQLLEGIHFVALAVADATPDKAGNVNYSSAFSNLMTALGAFGLHTIIRDELKVKGFDPNAAKGLAPLKS